MMQAFYETGLYEEKTNDGIDKDSHGIVTGISKTKPRMRHLINVKEPHFFHFEA
jgi:hypothetical protein